ncbi:MAG: hypothetical protein EA398_11800 [Deltaproteobacteria bacterium]|nr:MAG: hypothetical protein EA398_11800 [Deltaproteobacteria bacterium]
MMVRSPSPLRTFSLWLVCRSLLRAVALLALVGGCNREGPRERSGPPEAVEQAMESTEAPGESGALAEDPVELVSPPGLRARGRVMSVPDRLRARLIEAIVPLDDGALVATLDVRPPRADIRVYRLGSASGGAFLEPVGEEALGVGRVRSTVPRLVPLAGQGLAVFQSLDFLSEVDKERALLQWWASGESGRLDGPDVLPLPEGFLLGREVSMGAVGRHVALCGSRVADLDSLEDEVIEDVYCGLWAPGEGRWVSPLEPVVRGGNGIVQFDVLGGGEHGAFLLRVEADGEGWRPHGTLLLPPEEDGQPMRVVELGELSGEALGAGRSSFVWSTPPLASVGPDTAAYYLPRVGDDPARGGQVLRSGERLGDRRQLPSWPARTERAVMLPGAEGHLMLFDSLGPRGERTLVRFAEAGIHAMDYWTPLDTADHAAMARLGAATAGVVAMVQDVGDRPGVISVLEGASLLARPPAAEEGGGEDAVPLPEDADAEKENPDGP